MRIDLAPRIYQEFLREGSPEPLVPVFRHNQMDLRGLAALSCRVLSLLADPGTCGHDALELYGVSRLCERRGELNRARTLYQRSIASSLPAETDRVARESREAQPYRISDWPRVPEPAFTGRIVAVCSSHRRAVHCIHGSAFVRAPPPACCLPRPI